jgi:hypothetical protein
VAVLRPSWEAIPKTFRKTFSKRDLRGGMAAATRPALSSARTQIVRRVPSSVVVVRGIRYNQTAHRTYKSD